MIHITLSNEMLDRIIAIENCRALFPEKRLPSSVSSRLRKISMKRSTYASNKIEGNPLTEEQAENVVENIPSRDEDKHLHRLKPEDEIRNYYEALELLNGKLKKHEPFSKELLLEVQRHIVRGEGPEKAGIRRPMPPGVLFAVYDSQTGKPEYIPPEAADIEPLLEELFQYVEHSDDHPLIKAGIIHYQLATIHPFEDGNGRTARIMSGYYLDLSGFGFGGIGSLEEYFAYDIEEYYDSLQMGLPALYYDGRNDPPHPEIWMNYFLRMVELYGQKVLSIANANVERGLDAPYSYLKPQERRFYDYLLANEVTDFAPIDMARSFNITNKTIINWCAALTKQGLLEPQIFKQRIRRYRVVQNMGD